MDSDSGIEYFIHPRTRSQLKADPTDSFEVTDSAIMIPRGDRRGLTQVKSSTAVFAVCDLEFMELTCCF